MRDVSLNPIRPLVTEINRLTWLDDPAIAKSLVTLTAGAMHVVVAPEVGGAHVVEPYPMANTPARPAYREILLTIPMKQK